MQIGDGRRVIVSVTLGVRGKRGGARRIEFTVESFLLAPFLLQGTDLVAVVPERAAGHLRRTADVRFLEPPLPLPGITEMLWWHPRHTADPAHAWLRARIAEIAAELDPAAPAV